MSTATEAPEKAATPRCPRCGAGMAPEQDWCLECGSAVTTRVLAPPGWRVPVAVVLGALALVGAIVAITLSLQADDADEAAGGRAAGGAAAPTTPAPAPTPVTVWPAGKQAHTVIALTTRDRALAETRARRLSALGRPAGILRTDGFQGFSPGYWLVWVGQYRDHAAALSARASLPAQTPPAYATLVRPKLGG